MPHKISSECISCGSCISVCPTGAIVEGKTQCEIDKDTCIDCGACAMQCPVNAIEPE